MYSNQLAYYNSFGLRKQSSQKSYTKSLKISYKWIPFSSLQLS